MESARLATEHDLDRVVELWGHAARELGSQRGGGLLIRSVTPPTPLGHSLAADLGRSDRILAVGFIDDVIVGFGYGKVEGRRVAPDVPSELPSVTGDRIGVIEVLYVEPEGRGIGVGEALADVLMERFEALGCLGVDAFALPGNRAAKAFFETHGFVTRMLVMHRPARSAD